MKYDRDGYGSSNDVPTKFLRHRAGFKKVGKNLFKVSPRPMTVDEFNKLVKSKTTLATLMAKTKVDRRVTISKLFQAETYTRVFDTATIRLYEMGEEALHNELHRYKISKFDNAIRWHKAKVENAKKVLAACEMRLDKLRQQRDLLDFQNMEPKAQKERKQAIKEITSY